MAEDLLVNLALLAESHPDEAVALVEGNRRLSYGEVRDAASRWRSDLSRQGVVPGHRVALVSRNSADFVAAYLGILGTGAVAVPLNPASPEPELARETAAVDPVLVLREDDLAELPAPAGEPAPVVERDLDDPAVLLFTSGTAGFPKPAVLTHGSLLANLRQIQSHPGRRVTAEDVGVALLPFFHVFGLNVVLNLSLMVGGRLVLADGVEAGLDAVAEHAVSLVAGVPALFDAWARLAGPGSDALGTVRMAISGAAPLGPEVAVRFRDSFGIPLWQGYGLTEASPVVTSPLMEAEPVLGSVGIPLPGVEVRLADPSGEPARVGDPGEVWVRGPNVFKGYWQDPEATASVFEDGWLRTGDVAVADGQGSLFLVDRAKDLVIVSGFNVYPQEVESTIATVDGVSEVAVVGASRHGREVVVAYVVAAPEAKLVEGDVIGACRAQLAAYKCPAEVIFVDSLPRSFSGEVLRRELARRASSEAG